MLAGSGLLQPEPDPRLQLARGGRVAGGAGQLPVVSDALELGEVGGKELRHPTGRLSHRVSVHWLEFVHIQRQPGAGHVFEGGVVALHATRVDAFPELAADDGGAWGALEFGQ